MFKKTVIDPMVEKIAQRQTKPIIDASIDDIALEIEQETGKAPSKSAIWNSLHRIGAVSSGKRWIYQHNKGRHE
jgi:hypothetical protein